MFSPLGVLSFIGFLILCGVCLIVLCLWLNKHVQAQVERQIDRQKLRVAHGLLQVNGAKKINQITIANEQRPIVGMWSFRAVYHDGTSRRMRYFAIPRTEDRIYWLDDDAAVGVQPVSARVRLSEKGSKEQIIDELSAENARLRVENARLRQQVDR